MWLLLYTAQESILPEALDEINELGIWGVVTTMAIWAFRVWWLNRVEIKDKKHVEKRLEVANGGTLSGSTNPGRSLAKLVELIYDDLQMYKTETNGRFDEIHVDLGEMKGKLEVLTNTKKGE